MSEPKPNTINIMLDLETVGTKPGCGILSIGAVVFIVGDAREEPILTDYFYERIDPESFWRYDLLTDNATMLWWDKQSEAARLEAFGGKLEVKNCLHHFANWYHSVTLGRKPENVRLWGNGASFDEPILKEAYGRCGLANNYPIHYSSSGCYRTLIALYPELAKVIPEDATLVAHRAIDDATRQARIAAYILSRLENGNGK